MCYCDGDEPKVMTEKVVKARKQHRCCECLADIWVGEEHEHVRGIWDDVWESYRTCMACVKSWEALGEPCRVIGKLRELQQEAIGQ